MAETSTLGQKTVGTSAVQLTATAGQEIYNGVVFSVDNTTAKTYYGFSSGVTKTTGFFINGTAQIAPGDTEYLSDIYLISDTAGQQVSYKVIGQVATIT